VRQVVVVAMTLATVVGMVVVVSSPSHPIEGDVATQLDVSQKINAYWACAAGNTCRFNVSLGFHGQSSIETSKGAKKGASSPTTEWVVQLTHQVGNSHEAQMRFEIKTLIGVFGHGSPRQVSGQDSRTLVQQLEQHPAYFTQYADGTLGNIYYSPKESSKVKRLKQQIISLFELRKASLAKELLDGREAPSVVSYSADITANNATVYTAHHDYTDEACIKINSSRVLSPTFLRNNAKSLLKKEQLFRTKTTRAIIEADGTLRHLVGHAGLTFGTFNASGQAELADSGEETDQISTMPGLASFQHRVQAEIKLVQTQASEVPSLASLVGMAHSSFDPADSLLGLSTADIEDLAKDAMHEYSVAAPSPRPFRELGLLMARERRSAPIVARVVAQSELDPEAFVLFSEALGVAAADCVAKGACAAAQQELMRLQQNHRCDDSCASDVIEQLHKAAIATVNSDHHSELSTVLGKHGRKLLDAGGVWPDLPDDKAKAAEQAAEQAQAAAQAKEYLAAQKAKIAAEHDDSGLGPDQHSSVGCQDCPSQSCNSRKAKSWSYPHGCTDPATGCSWGVELDTGLGWDCEDTSSSGGVTVAADAGFKVHVFGRSMTVVGATARFEGAGTTGGSKGAQGSLTVMTQLPVTQKVPSACPIGYRNCHSWLIQGAPESAPSSSAGNPATEPGPPQGAANCTEGCSDDTNKFLKDYVFLDPKHCGDAMHATKPLASKEVKVPFALSTFFGVVMVTGEIDLTGTASVSYDLEMDLCSAFAGDSETQKSADELGVYLTAGTSAGGSIGMDVVLSGGIPIVVKLAVSTRMVIIEGSLSAFASIGGADSLDGTTEGGLINVDYNGAALNGQVAFTVTVLHFWDYQWTLFSWNGRELKNTPLLEYNLVTGIDAKSEVSFAKGDLADYETCDPYSRSSADLCLSSYCAWRPSSEYCDWDGKGTPSCDSSSTYQCRPVAGFAEGTACGITSRPQPKFFGTAPPAVNECAAGLFCYAGNLYGVKVPYTQDECWEYKSGLIDSDGDGEYNGCAWTRTEQHCPDQPSPRPWFPYTGDKTSLAYKCCCGAQGYEGLATQGYSQTCQKPLSTGAPIPRSACVHDKTGDQCVIADNVSCVSDYCASKKCNVVPSLIDQNGVKIFGGSWYAVCQPYSGAI